MIKNSKARLKIDRQIGENLRKIRTSQRLSQKALAESVGLTFQQVQKYENGTNRLSCSTMYDLAQVLNVEREQFFIKIFPDKDLSISGRHSEHERVIQLYDLAPKRLQKGILKLLEVTVVRN